MEEEFDEEELRRQNARKRIREARRRKRRREQRIRQSLVLGAAALLFILLIFGRKALLEKQEPEEPGQEQAAPEVQEIPEAGEEQPDPEPVQPEPEMVPAEAPEESKAVYTASAGEQTRDAGGEVASSYAILIDLDTDQILARRNERTEINPASMTKILTVLTAAEQIGEEQLEEPFTITQEMVDFSFANGCSNAGFEKGETVTVRDLFYGTILPSGGEAAAALAVYVSGSMDAFVEKMNQKLEELGLSETAHVTNCAGLYDENHRCTVYDMAMILEAALDNPFCKEVLSAHTYTTSVTEQHPEGMLLSNWFLRRIEDKDTGGQVVCGKTGYVQQSGNCAASYGVDKSGKEYVCVTADASSGWRCIYDHVALYKAFAQEGTEE